MLRVLLCFISFILFFGLSNAQVVWQNVDSLYQPLPSSVHVYYTNSKVDTGNFRAFYVVADLKNKQLDFTTDTTYKRRLTPSKFYEKNDKPLVVVNGTFFSFETNQNLNVVVKDGKLVSYNVHTIPGRGKDSSEYWHVFRSAIGIDKKRNADIAWLMTDTTDKFAHDLQQPVPRYKNAYSSFKVVKQFDTLINDKEITAIANLPNWKVETAIGGGPVLVQNGQVFITNEEEMMFTGKAINDKHPRTAMGYTADNKLIIMVAEGRNPGVADGASLMQLAQLMKEIGCVEALNLDGGGSSCLLINGKETIKVSDKTGQRPVPAVFLIGTR